MKVALNKLETNYKAALKECLTDAGEAALLCAYEAGHQAVQDGLGLMTVISIHREQLLALLSQASTPAECIKIVEMTHDLLAECLVPFEFTHRGFKEIESAKRDLESFSYSVSHDLRAPLRAIDGFSRILGNKIQGKLSADERRRFDVIRENVKIMDDMIEGLLAFSRLGRSAIQASNFDMKGLATEIWDEQRILNPGRNMELHFGDVPEAYGDHTLLREVLMNLFSNSIKFTRYNEHALIEFGGKIDVVENVYYVKDDGAGFDMKHYGTLFGVFQRLHSTSEYEGTGVGLALVKRIIDRHGGRVWAEGKIDEGATFYFTLPRKEE